MAEIKSLINILFPNPDGNTKVKIEQIETECKKPDNSSETHNPFKINTELVNLFINENKE